MRHEARFSCMEIYNSKFGGNIYSDFEDKFGVLPGVHFRLTIYFSLGKSKVQHFKWCAYLS